MISCTPGAARRITASFFHSLPEPWRMDGVQGGWQHLLPSTPHPCGHRLSRWGLSRTDASTSLCLHPLSPTLGPQAAPEELFPATLLTETLRWVYRLGKKPYASLPFWKAPQPQRVNDSPRAHPPHLALRKRTFSVSSLSEVSSGLESLWADSVAP